MAARLRQFKSGTGSGGGFSGVAFDSAVLADSVILVTVASYNNPLASAPTGNGNTYSLGVADEWSSDAALRFRLWYVADANSGSTTITLDDVSGDVTMYISEWTGIDNASPIAVTATANEGSSSTNVAAPATGALPEIGDIVYSAFTHVGGNVTIAHDAADGFNQIDEREDGTTQAASATQFKVAGRTASLTANWTLGSAQAWMAHTVALKPAAAADPIMRSAVGAKSAGGTTTVTVAYPGLIAADQMALAGRCAWEPTVSFTDEGGWTASGSLAGGTGTATDNHQTAIRADRLELAGSESGSVTFDQTVGGQSGCVGIMVTYDLADTGDTWDVATATGDDATHGANRSITASSSIALAPGDVVTVFVAVDTDTALTVTSPAITASGITFDTTWRLTSGAGVSTGDDGNIEVFEATVTSGTGTVAPTLAFTTATSQCGPATFVRLRANSGGTSGTATPAAIAVTASLPAVTTAAGSAATPAAISTATTMPAATAQASHTAAPAAIPVAAALPAATTQAGSAASPNVTAASVTMPAVAVAAGATVTPDALTLTIALPAVSATGGGSATATPDVIAIPVAIPAAVPVAGATAAPAATAVTVSLPGATLQAGSAATPSAIPVTVTIPQASATGSNAETATPAAITTTVTMPAATPQAGSTAATDSIELAVTMPAAIAQASHAAAPTVIPVAVTTPAAATRAGAVASPDVIAVVAVTPAPTLEHGSVVSPDAIALAVTIGAVIASGTPPDTAPVTVTMTGADYTITVTAARNAATFAQATGLIGD